MIICGYQGVGKSTYCRNNPETTVDLDSSNFKKVEGWEDSYINTALKYVNKKVFISAHPSVINKLHERGVKFIILAPKMNENAWRSRLEFRYFKNPIEANMKAIYDFYKNYDSDMKFYYNCEKKGITVKWVTASIVTDIDDLI